MEHGFDKGIIFWESLLSTKSSQLILSLNSFSLFTTKNPIKPPSSFSQVHLSNRNFFQVNDSKHLNLCFLKLKLAFVNEFCWKNMYRNQTNSKGSIVVLYQVWRLFKQILGKIPILWCFTFSRLNVEMHNCVGMLKLFWNFCMQRTVV